MKKYLFSLVALCSVACPVVAQEGAAVQGASAPVAAAQSPAAQSPAIQSAAAQDTVVEEIVARVNNSIITRADLRRNREQSAQDPKQADLTPQQIEEREANSLRDLIDQQLLVQRAADLGISADADLVKRLDDLRKEMKASSLEELQKMAESQGISWEEFKQNTKNGMLAQKVIGSEVGSHLQITREEAQKFYDEHKSDFAQPERIRLSEILISTGAAKPETGSSPTEASPEQVAAAEAKANEIYRQLKSGAKFDELARKESSGSTADRGGDLGYFKRNDLAKELEDKSFVLKTGEFTPPIRTRQGFIILRVNDHIEAGVPSLDRVREQIQEQLYSQKVQPALREYLTKLREEAYIDVKPGYTDSGASPNQTKLIYSSDSGPQTKQVRGKFGMGKKKTVLVADTPNHSKPTGSTSGLGRAKSELDAKEKAENDRKAAAAAKTAAEAAEKEKLSHMTPQERSKYLAQKKRDAKKLADLEAKQAKTRKQLASKEAAQRKAQAKRKAQEAKDIKNGKKPTQTAAADGGEQADAGSAPPKKKKSISWF